MAGAGDGYSVERCMADAREALARYGSEQEGRQRLGELLRRLAGTRGLIAEQVAAGGLHGTDSAATVLWSDGDDGLMLMLAKFADTAPTPIHDHGSWGVACVVRGRDRYQRWERVDDGPDPARGEVRLLEERELGPGEVVTWGAPPNDLHAQQGVGGPAWEVVLFGRNVMVIPRHYFDVATGTVRVALP